LSLGGYLVIQFTSKSPGHYYSFNKDLPHNGLASDCLSVITQLANEYRERGVVNTTLLS
jgi:hypothetical protein